MSADNVVSLGFGKFSGGELAHGVSHVWALPILGGSVAHFYVLKRGEYHSRCGHSVIPARFVNGQCSLLGIGSFGKCKLCQKPRRGRGSY